MVTELGMNFVSAPQVSELVYTWKGVFLVGTEWMNFMNLCARIMPCRNRRCTYEVHILNSATSRCRLEYT